jgi:hypothetical protein
MQIANLGDFISVLKAELARLLRSPFYEADVRPLVGRPFDCWYRGERDPTWNLQPKVFRARYGERDLTNRFRVLSKSRHDRLPDYDNYGLYLSLMQHYRLPTRLLDWSTSPLVGLYFAIEKYIYEPTYTPSDASVWILDPYRLNQIEIGETATPSIEGWSVRKFLRPAFTDYGPSSPGFRNSTDDYLEGQSDKVCAVMGAETDTRIFAQQGSFTIHTSSMPLQRHSKVGQFLNRIVIPSNSVGPIAEEIFLCGLRKSTLFPDLTNLAEDLEARYK